MYAEENTTTTTTTTTKSIADTRIVRKRKELSKEFLSKFEKS
jgi:hypothetical protein